MSHTLYVLDKNTDFGVGVDFELDDFDVALIKKEALKNLADEFYGNIPAPNVPYPSEDADLEVDSVWLFHNEIVELEKSKIEDVFAFIEKMRSLNYDMNNWDALSEYLNLEDSLYDLVDSGYEAVEIDDFEKILKLEMGTDEETYIKEIMPFDKLQKCIDRGKLAQVILNNNRLLISEDDNYVYMKM